MATLSGSTVDARFREIAALFGDLIAVRHHSTVTYRQLDARSDEIAACLTGASSVIGLSLTRPAEMIAGMLGVLKAGFTYTLIDPDAPLKRKQAIVAEMAIGIVIGDSADRMWPGYAGRWIDAMALPLEASGVGPASSRSPTDTCCIVQTSGTTGAPLGVEISHTALLHTIENYTALARITPTDRLTMLTSAAHFAAHTAIFGALLNGACLCPFDVKSGGFAAMAEWLDHEGLTIYQSPPSLFRAFCRQQPSSRHFQSLRFLRLGGEPALISDYELFKKHFRVTAQFVNALGISEAGGNVAYYCLDRADDLTGEVLPVGLPSSGHEVLLVDPAGEPVPAGEIGEIVVRGEFLATGYYRHPELTSQKFRMSDTDGRRELWTGDLGHITPAGWLMHDGRKDDQVKIRGFRVNLVELESALRSCAGVREARILNHQRADHADELIAFIVRTDTAVTADEVHAQLADLTHWNVLPRVVIVNELPLNPGGKLNRARLFELATNGAAQASPSGPRDATEHAVVDAWKAALKVAHLGIHDNFFAAGGDSLKALSARAALEHLYKRPLSPTLFLDYPTAWQMAAAIQATLQCPTNSDTTPFMTFQASGQCPPLFFLHGDWTGGGIYCGHLASHLGDEQPFHAIAPYEAATPCLVTIEEMAADHLAAIRQRTPRGPYRLGGYCIGAIVAMEIAGQLLAQGEKVTCLLLIDPARSGAPWLRFVWPLIDKMGNVLGWGLRQRISHMELYGMRVVHWFRKSRSQALTAIYRRLNAAIPPNSPPPLDGDASEENEAAILTSLSYAVYVLAYRRYRLRPISVPTTIYLPADRPSPPRYWTRRLHAIFTRASFQIVPGDHRTCIIVHQHELGSLMKIAIASSMAS